MSNESNKVIYSMMGVSKFYSMSILNLLWKKKAGHVLKKRCRTYRGLERAL